jgi:hypothetical protein
MSFWYLAHENELMCDLDEYARSTKNGEAYGEVFFRRRLRQAMLSDKLFVNQVYMLPSQTQGHFHAIVTMKMPMGELERLVWQLHLGSDLYRGRADLMRHARGFKAPSLLITPWKIPEFRAPDAECKCTEKHVTEKQFALPVEDRCEVWKAFRGHTPWELFGVSARCTESPVPLPRGIVPLELITRVDYGNSGS